jgi:hypothetical protein
MRDELMVNLMNLLAAKPNPKTAAMPFRPKSWIVSFFLLAGTMAKAQLQVDQLSFKGFNAIGFGGFLNFSVPVSDANYVTAEIGLDYFSSHEDHAALAPLLAGYRYTIDGSGTGFYIEPNAGYAFAGTDIQVDDGNGIYSDQKISGLSTGLALGYLFEPSRVIQFNLSLRYEHIFGDAGSNMLSFRISHAFNFGRRNRY